LRASARASKSIYSWGQRGMNEGRALNAGKKWSLYSLAIGAVDDEAALLEESKLLLLD